MALTLMLSATAQAATTGVVASSQAGETEDATLGSDAGATLGGFDAREWALRDILASRFAHTPTLERALRLQTQHPVAVDTQFPPWVEQLKEAMLLEHLHGTHAAPTTLAALQPQYDIPLAEHPLVDRYIDYFTGSARWFFTKWLRRADRYMPIMRPLLKAKGLPEDLVFIAMVESGFSAKAHSWASASGYWQFIRSTGKTYGLRIDFWVDERRDFIRSTNAAADFLIDLHRRFGDWHLAWAGYNAGGGRVSRALAKYGETTFWGLLRHPRSLARETQHYVPKIIAAAIIAKNREKYGFGDLEPMEPHQYETIQVKQATELKVIAKKLNIPEQDLRALNPAYLRGVTAPGKTVNLRVPPGTGAPLVAWLDKLPVSKRLSYKHHRIQSGDTLYGIARAYGTTVSAIKDFNRIRNPRLLRLGQRLVIPMRGLAKASKRSKAMAQKSTSMQRSRSSSKARSKQARARHVVSSGETLWSIARHYGVTVSSLKEWNERRSDSLGVGDTLMIF